MCQFRPHVSSEARATTLRMERERPARASGASAFVRVNTIREGPAGDFNPGDRTSLPCPAEEL